MEGRRAEEAGGEGGREAEVVGAAVGVESGPERVEAGVGLENEAEDPREAWRWRGRRGVGFGEVYRGGIGKTG